MKEEIEDKKELITMDATANAVQVIKAAILQSQQRALKAINQEQLALYYGIGRYVSANTRKKNWGKGALTAISEQLRKELPGLKGFSATNLKNMRIFYEEWRMLENYNSSGQTDEFTGINTKSSVLTDETYHGVGSCDHFSDIMGSVLCYAKRQSGALVIIFPG